MRHNLNELFIAAVAASLMSHAALASDWVSVGKSDDGTAESFIDVSSAKVSGNARVVWMKSIVQPGAPVGISEALQHTFFNCKEESFRIDSIVTRYADGTSRTDNYHDPRFNPVPPDTMNSAAMNFVCALKL